jgi:hypothetical protein
MRKVLPISLRRPVRGNGALDCLDAAKPTTRRRSGGSVRMRPPGPDRWLFTCQVTDLHYDLWRVVPRVLYVRALLTEAATTIRRQKRMRICLQAKAFAPRRGNNRVLS